MKLEHVAFALIVLIGLLFYGAPLVPEPAGGHGAAHPDHPSMLVGGDGPQRHAEILWLGWAMGVVQILFFVTLMLMGARKKGRTPPGLGRPFAIGTVAYLAAWTAIVLTYRSTMMAADAGATTLYAALPAPTALMLYALWPTPLVFAACFVVGFRRWVLSEEDEEAFAKLVARRQAARAYKAESRAAETEAR